MAGSVHQSFEGGAILPRTSLVLSPGRGDMISPVAQATGGMETLCKPQRGDIRQGHWIASMHSNHHQAISFRSTGTNNRAGMPPPPELRFRDRVSRDLRPWLNDAAAPATGFPALNAVRLRLRRQSARKKLASTFQSLNSSIRRPLSTPGTAQARLLSAPISRPCGVQSRDDRTPETSLAVPHRAWGDFDLGRTDRSCRSK